MKWTTKARIQRFIAMLPEGQRIYHLAHQHVGPFRNFKIDNKLRNGLDLLECLYEAGEDMKDKRTVEIGTGHIPVLPLLFWLCGQGTCRTYDLSKLLIPRLVAEAAKQLSALSGQPGSRLNGWRGLDEERKVLLNKFLKAGVEGEQLLERCNIMYKAPADAVASGLPGESTDVVYSNTVLEHVPRPEIYRIYKGAYRILRPGGYMLHLIDLSDHYSYSDPAITGINFYQFSEEDFAKYNNTFLYQNRLTAAQHREILEACGFEIVRWKGRVDNRAMEQVRTLKLHADYAETSPEELCIGSIRVAARRP